MKILKIAPNDYIVADDIAYISDYTSKPVQRLVHEMKEDQKLYDATHKKKIKSVIVCKDNRIYLSNVAIPTLIARINEMFDEKNTN